MDYTFKRLNKERLNDLLYLIKAIYNREDDISKVYQKYNTKVWGAEYIGYIAYSPENEPAAYYGVLPIQIIYKGKKYLAAQSGDTMTHPNHRRKGLFTRTAKVTYDLASQEGIEFVFGFPNYNSYPGFVKKLSWTHETNIQSYNFIVPTFPLSELAYRIPYLKKFYNRYQRFILSLFKKDVLWFASSSSEEDGHRVNHDEHYYKYKAASDKVIIQNNKNYIWLKSGKNLSIGDMQFSSTDDIKSNLRKVKFIAFLCGIWRVNTYVSPNSRLNKELNKLQSPKKGLPIGFVNFTFEYPISEIEFIYSDFDTY